MNIAVADIETLEYFFAHTIGPMFTVILLPVTTIALAWFVNPLYALVLIPIYVMISVVLPLGALIAGRGIGMRLSLIHISSSGIWITRNGGKTF